MTHFNMAFQRGMLDVDTMVDMTIAHLGIQTEFGAYKAAMAQQEARHPPGLRRQGHIYPHDSANGSGEASMNAHGTMVNGE